MNRISVNGIDTFFNDNFDVIDYESERPTGEKLSDIYTNPDDLKQAEERLQFYKSLAKKSPAIIKTPSEIIAPVSGDGFSRADQIYHFLDDSNDFRRNIITQKSEISPKGKNEFVPLTDAMVERLRFRLCSMLSATISADVFNMVLSGVLLKEYDPITEFYNSLPEYDGRDALAELSLLFDVIPGQFEGEDSATVFYEYLKAWIVGMVATHLTRGNDINHECLTLIGDQGIGKTRALKKIGIPEYVFTGSIDPQNKDDKALIAQYALIILDELETTTRSELGALKCFMTLNSVSYRRPYGRLIETYPRIASFAACANEKAVLQDLTGSRRWLCVEISGVKYDEITPELVKRCYAQARKLYESGFQYWYGPSQVATIERRNTPFKAAAVEEEALLSKYEPVSFTSCMAEFKTNTEILQSLSDSFNAVKLSPRKLGQLLQRHGFERGKKDGLYKYALNRRG